MEHLTTVEHLVEERDAEIRKLKDNYGQGSDRAGTNSSNQDAVAKANRYIETSLRNVAVDYNNEAKNY